MKVVESTGLTLRVRDDMASKFKYRKKDDVQRSVRRGTINSRVNGNVEANAIWSERGMRASREGLHPGDE